MHLQSYFNYPVRLTSSHQQLVDHPATSAPAPRCMDLVWQALHGAQVMARQALRYLDCRPGLPSDTLEAPAAAHQREPEMSLAPAEVAAEECPQSAAALPVAPAPLKSVLLPESHGKRTQRVQFAHAPSIRHIPRRDPLGPTGAPDPHGRGSGSSLSNLLQDASSLNFSVLDTPTGDAATEGFKPAVQAHVRTLQGYAEVWNNPRLNVNQRMELVLGCKKQLQELHARVRALKKALKADPAAQARVDAAKVNRTLSDRLIELELEIRHADKLIAACKQALETESRTSTESWSSDTEEAVDFNRILQYVKGDTEASVRSMHGPLVKLTEEYSDLEEAASNSPAGSIDWELAVEGIVGNLDQMGELLTDHALAYTGQDRGFRGWLTQKIDDLQQERQGWERMLAKYSF